MYKKCQVVMLPTNQKATDQAIITNNQGNMWFLQNDPITTEPYADKFDMTINHLYILSDDEVEIGDYVIAKFLLGKRVLECTNHIFKHNCAESPNLFKKIIASTDSSLNLPSPSKEFLQIYCEKQPKEVMVKYNQVAKYRRNDMNFDYSNQLCIKDNQISIKKIKQTYTREEVQPLVDALTKAQELLNESADAGYYPQSALQISGGQGFGFITEILKSFNK